MLNALTVWLQRAEIPDKYLSYTVEALAFCLLLLTCWISFQIGKIFLLRWIRYIVKKSENTFDDHLLKNRVFEAISHFIPAILLMKLSGKLPNTGQFLQSTSQIYLCIAVFIAFNAFLNSIDSYYKTLEISKRRSIKSYLQILKLLLAIFVIIYLLASLANTSPWTFISGLGALSAILLLIFKDAILGFVAGFQLAANNMIQIGDWIEMPKYQADGEVIEVSLTIVKVQNWDKTITTIPAYALVSDSFKNWRGMSESGGRRIKRSIHIDISSIRFLEKNDLDKLKQIQILQPYLNQKLEEISREYTAHENPPISGQEENSILLRSTRLNRRNLTNIGTFRAYIVSYLQKHPKINQNMTSLVRQLQPTETGLPIEIYVFCIDKAWSNYENIQSDIFDHLLSILAEFDLRIYQSPSGYDMQNGFTKFSGAQNVGND
jgi:miniconductance mechanosensitive channel